MISDDLDRQEVDRLVRELSSAKPPAPAYPPVGQAARTEALSPAAPGQVSIQAQPEREVRRVSRWTTARILMPAAGTAAPRKTFASLMHLPALPALRLPRLPGLSLPAVREETRSVIIVRAWVTLGLLLSVSMPYWPYPKTYLAGLLLYLFAVALLVVAGVWSAKLTWDVRLGGAHTVSLGIVLWAIVLVANETLPAVTGTSLI